MSESDYPINEGQGDESDEDIAAQINAEVGLSDDIPPKLGTKEPKFETKEDASEKVAALNDQVLRLAAELENTRRRGARDKVDAGKYAIAGFAGDLLSIADNFERALKAAPGENDEPSVEAVSNLLAGLKMTEKELLSVLERHGVKRISPAGEKFDPNLHQAVAQVPGGGIAVGHVVDVAQPGFTIGDRVLRAAMVTVSLGADMENEPPKAAGGQVDTQV